MREADKESACYRPPPSEIRAAWTKLFSDPLLSLSSLKAEGASLGPEGEDGGVILRSVYWRFYLGLLPPPTSLDLFPSHLATKRRTYDELRERFLIAPDGRWASDCSGGEGYVPSSPKGEMAGGWDPLSLDGDSPWRTWFEHTDLRALIRQDVDRTFPDMPYFAIERVRRSLVTMLFLFSVLNPDVGYRQGMHELLAVCLLVVDRDSLEYDATYEPALAATLNRTYIEHDAFGLFEQIMRPAKSFYEWRAEEGPPLRGVAPQAPIILRCNNINAQLIRRIDPQLWERFETEGVEAQIWAIRWLRLLLTRELPFSEALRLWDGMFAEDPSLGILDYVCIAMLLLIRNELIEADYPVMLTHLLHYPSPSPTYPFKPALIIAQAKLLRDNVSPAGGIEVVLQNQDLLGIKASGSEKPLIESEPATPALLFGRASPSPRPSSAPRAPKHANTKAGVQSLAQGLFERAQKAGLDKAILSTVTDLKNSLPDSTYAFFSPPGGSRESSPFSAIPSAAALPPRPVIVQPQFANDATIKSLLDAERQLAEVRLAMLGMGKAMAEWLDTLHGTGEADATEEETRDAWRGMERVRDGLIEAAASDVDELVKDWAWNDGLSVTRSRSSTATQHGMLSPEPRTPPPRTSSLQTSQTTPKASSSKHPQPTQIQVPLAAEASPPEPSQTSPSKAQPTSPEGIQLHLSSRNDRPKAALPRVPLHHPQPSVSITSPSSVSIKRLSANAESLPKPPKLQPPAPPSGPVDPLAGVGVGIIRSNSTREEDGRSAFRSSATSAPLLTGSDPLGANR